MVAAVAAARPETCGTQQNDGERSPYTFHVKHSAGLSPGALVMDFPLGGRTAADPHRRMARTGIHGSTETRWNNRHWHAQRAALRR